MSGIHSGFKRTTSDEGDGDLGLQGMHLETSPPRKDSMLDSPPERGHSLQVIKSRFGSQSRFNGSSPSANTSSYVSAREGGEEPPTFDDAVTPSSPSFIASDGAAAANPVTPPFTSARKSLSESVNSSSKSKSRFSKLRTEVAGPPSQRPLAGSINGPTLLPRGTSSAAFASTSSVNGGKNRPSSKEATRRRSSSAAGNGDISSSKVESLTLSGDTSSTGLLVGSPVLPFQDSSSTPKSSVVIPARKNLPAAERSRAKGRESGHSSEIPSQRGSKLITSSSDDIGTMRDESKSTAQSREMGMQRWVLSVGCVNFDLDKGPDLEFLYPSLGISREERDNIAFSSFPDTSIFDDGQAVFSWRVREVPLDSSGSEAPVIASPASQSRASSLKSFASQGRSSTLPAKSSPNALHSSGHKLWSFERGWKQSNRSLSSDSANASGIGVSQGSSRSASPLPYTNSPVMPSSPSSESKSSMPPLDRPGSNGTESSIMSGGSSAFVVMNSSESNIPKSAVPLVESVNAAIPETTANGVLRTGRSSRSSNYIHGYCFFRQRRDATIRRGYFQKSVVILSHLPYVSLFSEIVKKLGPLYFQNGMAALEAFSQDVQNWPPPEPGARMHLPLLGSVISVDLPFHSQFQTSLSAEARIIQNTNTAGKARSGLNFRSDNARSDKGSSGEEPILASMPSTPLFDIFRESLDHLWLLWECLILAEPILVVGPDPRICSEAVWHLINLIRPIPFAGDFRPFFTIHDYDFQTLVTKNKPNAGVILGVTNPFMLQACKHWPHVFKVGKAAIKTSTRIANRKSPSMSSQTGMTGSQGGGGGGIAGGNSAGGGGPEHVPGLQSKRKRRISKDRPLLRKLTEMAEKGTDDEAANAMLRRYFSDMTERFLAPLNRYVSSLIPAAFDLSSPSETPRIKPFNSTAFLASLKAHGTPLPIRSRNLPTGAAVRQSLYHEFIQCPNFSLWLHDRIAQAEEEQYNRRLKALEDGNISKFVLEKTELETIDLYSRLKMEIDQIDEKLKASKRERELEPNSRWKAPTTNNISISTNTSSSSAAKAAAAPAASSSSSPSTNNTPIRESFPALALSSEPPTPTTAKKIEEQIRTSGNTLTTGEKSLLTKKVHLIEQLDTLIKTLPADIRGSLHLSSEVRGR